MARKPISKKIRFEVFKRDSFKCQYCGSVSPDVTLEVDHIKPVAEGGGNEMMNLITSCKDCNAGKGARLLDDQTELKKQRAQLEDLNERRQQLEMMLEWRSAISDLEQTKIDAVEEQWEESLEGRFVLNENGLRDIKKWVKKYDLNILLESVDAAVNQYVKTDHENELDKQSIEKAFHYIPRIAANKSKGEEEEYWKDIYYIRGILRNRLHYLDEKQALKFLVEAHVEHDFSIESLKTLAKKVKNWTEFREEMELALGYFE